MFALIVLSAAAAAEVPLAQCGVIAAPCDRSWKSESTQSFPFVMLDQTSVQIKAPDFSKEGLKGWACLSVVNESARLSVGSCNDSSLSTWTVQLDGPLVPGVAQEVVYQHANKCLSVVGQASSTFARVDLVPCCSQEPNCTKAQAAEQTWTVSNPGARYPTVVSRTRFNNTDWCLTRVNGVKTCA